MLFTNNIICFKRRMKYYAVFILLIIFEMVLFDAYGKSNRNRKEENVNMTREFKQLYGNMFSNSLIGNECGNQGVIVKKIQFQNRESYWDIDGFYPVDQQYGLVYGHKDIMLFYLKDGLSVKNVAKNSNAAIAVSVDRLICFGYGSILCSPPEQFDQRKAQYLIRAHAGLYSLYTLIFPFDKTVIYGIFYGPFPKNDSRQILKIGCRAYNDGRKELWSREFDRPIPPRPVCNKDGNLIIYHKGVLHCIDVNNGSTLLEKPTDKEIFTCSVGPNGHLYGVATHDGSRYLVEWDEQFEERSAVEIIPDKKQQPPVTMNNGQVVLVGDSVVACYTAEERKWLYPRTGGEKAPFLATATANNLILLIDGPRLVCLDENGKDVWEYKKEDTEPFRTQPVVSVDGTVYVVDNNALYMIR